MQAMIHLTLPSAARMISAVAMAMASQWSLVSYLSGKQTSPVFGCDHVNIGLN